MVSVTPFLLDDTITARWRRRLVGSGAQAKRHWRTKTAYYRALFELLRAGRTDDLTWQSVVAATHPNGNRSTFYDVTGPSAKHALIDDLLATTGVDALQICLCYRDRGVVDQLIDETKVWAYWPHREALIARLRITPDIDVAAATEMLLSFVRAWARASPHLARALDHTPPLCAVEDLIVINAGRLSATNAYGVLAAAIRAAVEGRPVRDAAVA